MTNTSTSEENWMTLIDTNPRWWIHPTYGTRDNFRALPWCWWSPDGFRHDLRVQVIRELLVQGGFHREGLVDETYQEDCGFYYRRG
jgi:hypothetical protein